MSVSGHVIPGGLRFAVLGPLVAWRDGVPIDLGTPLQRSVLAMLLLRQGRAVTPMELIEGVWGHEAPRRALGAVRTYISRLRAVLEPDRSPRTPSTLLTSVGHGYALRLESMSFDLDTFDRSCAAADAARHAGQIAKAADLLRGALGLWSGEPLSGAIGPHADYQRDRLAERRIRTVETLMDLDLELGRHAEVISELVALTAEHPVHERLRAQLMLAYYRCGRQAEALAVFTETRQALVAELGIEPGAELTELHQRILAADPSLAPAQARRPAQLTKPVRLTPCGTAIEPAREAEDSAPGDLPTTQGPPPPDPAGGELPTPAQLPAAVADFTGRAGLVRRLLGLLRGEEGETVPIVALCGIGGVGKTALAVHVAHLVTDLFPDGQLYADLRGCSPEPLSPQTALMSFLRALGVSADVVPDGLPERSALFRSALAGRRMLVVLDNARDASQVEPLLPGTAGSAAIITSQVKLAALASARLIDLDVMKPGEALALLSAIVGPERIAAERAAAKEVVAICGFLPLAVRIVAARLAARPGWSVASLAARLADECHRLNEIKIGDLAVSATFSLGYRQLSPTQARAFRLLSLSRGSTISLLAGAALLDVSPAQAERVMESLVDTRLLEALAPGQYRFHDLLKLYARQQARREEPPEAQARTLRRLHGYYLTSARAAHKLAYQGSTVADSLSDTGVAGEVFTSVDESTTWLSAMAADLFAVVAQTVPVAEPLFAADLLLSMEPLVDMGTSPGTFEQHCAAVLATAQRVGDQHAELRCRYVLGRALLAANRTTEAERQFQAARELGMRTGDRIVLGETCNALAVIAGRGHRHIQALEWFAQARRIYRETGNRAGEALGLSYATRDHLGLGRPCAAIDSAERGLAIFTEIGSGTGAAWAGYHLGIALAAVGRLDEAVDHLTESLEFFRTVRHCVWQERVCRRLATILITAERFTAAARYAEQALAINRELANPYGEARCLVTLAKAMLGNGKTQTARELLTMAREVAPRPGSPEAEDIPSLVPELSRVGATTAW